MALVVSGVVHRGWRAVAVTIPTHLHTFDTIQCKAHITQQDTHAPSLASHVTTTMKAEFKESALNAGVHMSQQAKNGVFGCWRA